VKESIERIGYKRCKGRVREERRWKNRRERGGRVE